MCKARGRSPCSTQLYAPVPKRLKERKCAEGEEKAEVKTLFPTTESRVKRILHIHNFVDTNKCTSSRFVDACAAKTASETPA